MGQAFISYSRRDKDKVYAICDILTDAGFTYWLDKNDIPPTEQWRAEIVEGIKNSDSFILFISPSSLNSPNVIKELNIASEQEHKGSLRIIPVILIPTEIPKEAEYQLSGKQWIDLSVNFTKGLEDLIKTIGALSLPKGYKKHLLKYLPGTYITPELISPLPNPSKEVVIGKTINIKQIRDQRFMPRPKALENSLQGLDLLLSEYENNKEDEISTFWIHGRSGSGKSVLLLQLLQEIVLKRHAQAFWFFSDESEKLYDLFEKWAEQGIGLDEPLFVFIDDFNTPLTRDLMENKSIPTLLRNPTYTNVNWPVIVTCSPPEYLEDFRNGGKDEGFRIREWEIPTIGIDESKRLIQWFETRTGKKTKTGKAFEQPEGLALSMLFELWYNAQYQNADKNEDVMKAFGQRFKTRLDALNLTEAIAPILALNRLYIWPPNSWLKEMAVNQRDAFNILISDKDFSILSIKPSPSGFVRLTHPHLSDVIYQTIRPKNTSKITRAKDLATSFEKALSTNIIVANQTLRIVSDNVNLEKSRLASDEIDLDELAKLFTEIWTQQDSINNDTKGLLVYAWINWAVWNSKNPQISMYLNESNIIEKCLHYLGYEHKLWGELWQKLWACEPQNKRLLENAVTWLSQHRGNPGWAFVWQSLLEHPEALPEGTSTQSLLQLGLQWLNGREDKDQWSFVWQALAEHPDALPEGTSTQSILQLGLQWLNGHEDKDQWSFVWRAVLEHPDALPEDTSSQSILQLGLQWLNGHEDKDQWSFVWRAVLEHPDSLPEDTSTQSLLQLGLQWLTGREDKDQWAFVWQALLEHRNALPEGTSTQSILQLGLQWLNGREDKDQWSFVWRAVLEHPDALPEDTSSQSILQLGLQWLNGHEDKDQWSFVWQALAEHPDALPEGTSTQSILQLGLQWLNGHEDKDQWSFVWQALAEHPDALPEGTSTQSILQLGLQWLNGHEDKDQWSFVWQTLFQHKNLPSLEKDKLLKFGVNWLHNFLDRGDWNFVWKDVLTYSQLFAKELIGLGSKWLLLRDDHDQWSFVWQTLLQHPDALPEGTSTQSILQLGLQWLNGREDKGDWSFVWRTLLEHPDTLPEGTSTQSILQLGLQWLNGHEDKGDWTFVWRAVLEHPEALPEGTSTQSLLQLGLQWLNGREDKDQWSFVWRAVLEHPDALPEGTSTQSILQLGLQWLNGHEDKDQWSFVWRAVLEHPDALPEDTSTQSILQLGLQWLTGHEDKDQWSFVWQALAEHPDALPEGTSTQSILQLGLQWLNGHEDKDQWSFVWQSITKSSNLIGKDERDKLVNTGLIWLRVNQHRHGWPFIWSDLINLKSSLPKEIKNEILNLGHEWLDGKESHQSWSFVFENCLRNNAITQDLLTKGIHWVFSNENRQETPGIAFEIANHYEKIVPSERYRIHEWIKNWVRKSHPKNRGWSYGWAAYWKIMPTLETVDLGLIWIEANPEHTNGTNWIIQTLFRENRQDVNARIKKWLETHSEHPISEIIKKKLNT